MIMVIWWVWLWKSWGPTVPCQLDCMYANTHSLEIWKIQVPVFIRISDASSCSTGLWYFQWGADRPQLYNQFRPVVNPCSKKTYTCGCAYTVNTMIRTGWETKRLPCLTSFVWLFTLHRHWSRYNKLSKLEDIYCNSITMSKMNLNFKYSHCC